MLDGVDNLNIEQEVLGAMLIRDGEKIPEVLRVLTAEDFIDEKNRILFNHIAGLYLRGENPGDMLTIVRELEKTGELERVGLMYALAVPMWNFTNAYVESHVKIIKEKAEMRRLMDVAVKMYNVVQRGVDPVTEIVSEVQKELQEITGEETSRVTGFKNYLKQDFKAEIEESKKYAERKTGFENIDEHQIFSSGLYLLGATPAAGKTTFAWQMAEQLAKKGEICIYCSYEMSRRQRH